MDLPGNTNTVKFLELHILVCGTVTSMSGPMAAVNVREIAFLNVPFSPWLNRIVGEQ